MTSSSKFVRIALQLRCARAMRCVSLRRKLANQNNPSEGRIQIKCELLAVKMAATNIFYRIPSQRGIRVVSIAGTECTLDQFCDYVIDSEGLNRHDFIIASGTKVFRPSSCDLQSVSLRNNSHLDILIPLLGGKGGFGSLLRAIGAQIEKTTNRDACRDLSGRRLRDIKREEELRKLLALREKLQEEQLRRKKEKLEKLKKRNENSGQSSSIQQLVEMFDDHDYNKRRLELSDIIDAAVEKGIINSKKRQMDENKEVNSKKQRPSAEIDEKRKNGHEGTTISRTQSQDDSSEEDETSCSKNRVKGRISKTNKNDLWLGLEDGV